MRERIKVGDTLTFEQRTPYYPGAASAGGWVHAIDRGGNDVFGVALSCLGGTWSAAFPQDANVSLEQRHEVAELVEEVNAGKISLRSIAPVFCPQCLPSTPTKCESIESPRTDPALAQDGKYHTHDERQFTGIFSCSNEHSSTLLITNTCWCDWKQTKDTAP
jgi:hypothetical protein